MRRHIGGSSYFLAQSTWDWLKDNGIKQFDFGRIGPGKRSANSVYEFKSHSHGEEVSYNGEWVYAKNKFIETLFYILLNYKIKRW
jgi:hypothetical protein